MKNEMNEYQPMLTFLESARETALESLRHQRRLDELKKRLDSLKSHRSITARRLKSILEGEYKRELELIDRELDSYRRVERFIESLHDPIHRMILRRRYLEIGCSWSELRSRLAMDGLSYSQRQLSRMHTEALKAAWLLWQEEGEEA